MKIFMADSMWQLKRQNIHMKLPVYIVDAFTDKLFGGNPAAVCPLH